MVAQDRDQDGTVLRFEQWHGAIVHRFERCVGRGEKRVAGRAVEHGSELRFLDGVLRRAEIRVGAKCGSDRKRSGILGKDGIVVVGLRFAAAGG